MLCPWDSPGKNIGTGCPALLQGIFLTQVSNLHLLSRVQLFATPWTITCQAPLSMRFSRQEYWVAMPSSRRISPTQGSNSGLPHCRQILYHLSHQGRPTTDSAYDSVSEEYRDTSKTFVINKIVCLFAVTAVSVYYVTGIMLRTLYVLCNPHTNFLVKRQIYP